MYAWVNGELVEENQAAVPLQDAGFLHGAAVFTTMRAGGERVFRVDRHLARLRTSCTALAIPLEQTDEQLIGALQQLLRANALPAARVRITITRAAPSHPNGVFISAAPLIAYPAELYEHGARAAVTEPYRLNPLDPAAGHKTTDYVARLAAVSAAKSRGRQESLWLDIHDRLQSGSISNVFIVRSGEILTPPTTAELRDPSLRQRYGGEVSCVLPGITREVIFDLASRLSIRCSPAPLRLEDVRRAEECFLTNSIMGVMPVVEGAGTAIGAAPGPVTRRLIREYGELVGVAMYSGKL